MSFESAQKMTTQYLFLYTFVQSTCLAIVLSVGGRVEVQCLAIMVALASTLDLFSRYFRWRSTRKWVFLSALPAVLVVSVWMMVQPGSPTPATVNGLMLLFAGWFWMGVVYTIVASLMGRLAGTTSRSRQPGESSL